MNQSPQAQTRALIDAIIPAYNEASTIEAVVHAVLGAGVMRSLTVVDDGSEDDTPRVAEQAGARVLRLAPNRGKGAAMLAALAQSDAEAVGFFDADLIGLQPAHVQSLVAHWSAGFAQVCGLRDHGLLSVLQLCTPVITGERIVCRWVLERLPVTCWRGYAIETAINDTVDRHQGSTCLVPMPGVTIRGKTAKVGVIEGWRRHLRMIGEMRGASRRLEESDGRACT